jgi:hypothetical protein
MEEQEGFLVIQTIVEATTSMLLPGTKATAEKPRTLSVKSKPTATVYTT